MEGYELGEGGKAVIYIYSTIPVIILIIPRQRLIQTLVLMLVLILTLALRLRTILH